MSTQKEEAKKDVYQIVTDRIITHLENGVIPWKQPWSEWGVPKNLITKNTYRGINLLLLLSLGYERNFFLTSKQIAELGASVKEGQKPHIVVYWNWVEPKEECTQEVKGKKIPFLRYYLVYNVDQCEGIEEDKIPAPKEREFTPIAVCEDMVQNMPNLPTIRHKEQKAYYHPVDDFINLPKQKSFDNEDRYYATLFHELVHSTGHRSRLNRKGLLDMTPFGSEPYSFEELVAEIGASYLCFHAGIESPLEQQAAYIQGWLGVLKGDKRFILQASSFAQKATDYILNIQSKTSDDTPNDSASSGDDLPF